MRLAHSIVRLPGSGRGYQRLSGDRSAPLTPRRILWGDKHVDRMVPVSAGGVVPAVIVHQLDLSRARAQVVRAKPLLDTLSNTCHLNGLWGNRGRPESRLVGLSNTKSMGHKTRV